MRSVPRSGSRYRPAALVRHEDGEFLHRREGGALRRLAGIEVARAAGAGAAVPPSALAPSPGAEEIVSPRPGCAAALPATVESDGRAPAARRRGRPRPGCSARPPPPGSRSGPGRRGAVVGAPWWARPRRGGERGTALARRVVREGQAFPDTSLHRDQRSRGGEPARSEQLSALVIGSRIGASPARGNPSPGDPRPARRGPCSRALPSSPGATSARECARRGGASRS